MAASALASGMLMLGQQFVGSAEPDTAVQADNQGDLVSQALAQGLIDQSDLAFAPAAANAVSALPTLAASGALPNSGPLGGGQIVVLTGTNFTGATAVKFYPATGDAVDAPVFAVVNATKIVVKVPSNTAGAKTIKVTTGGDGGGESAAGATYTYVASTVTGVTPAFSDPATSKTVTITGTGFTGAVKTEVKFGTYTSPEIWVVSDTQIIATTPKTTTGDGAITVAKGVVDVVVTRNSVDSATSAASKFLFSPDVANITDLKNSSDTSVTGTGNDGVNSGSFLKIVGTNLFGVTKVNFGSSAVTLAADIVVPDGVTDGTSLNVKVPARAANLSGPVDITIENPVGVSSVNLKTRFNFIGTVAPTITSVTPNVLSKAATGGGGTFLVSGTGFSGATTAKVSIKCAAETAITPTSVVVVSDTSLIVTAPTNGTGGNAGSAESCALKIENAADATKSVTSNNAIKYV